MGLECKQKKDCIFCIS